MAEADYYIQMQPRRPKARRMMYRIYVTLSSVIDLSNWVSLKDFGVEKETFATTDYSQSQKLGGAVEWLRHDGLLIPSARSEGINLVIFPNSRSLNHRFEVLDSEEIAS